MSNNSQTDNLVCDDIRIQDFLGGDKIETRIFETRKFRSN